jgi:hypothetical protein
MANGPRSTAAQLADQLSGGFAALSEEYQVLVDQHRELENKLSWAKQQVSIVLSLRNIPPLYDETIFSSRSVATS